MLSTKTWYKRYRLTNTDANLSIRFSRPDRRIRAAASPAAEISETLIHKITVRFIAMMKRVPADRRNCWMKKRKNEMCGKL